MPAERNDALRATREATKITDDFQDDRRTSFDIQRPFEALGIPLHFAKLDGLLGAAIYTEEGLGALITTERTLPIQRFTMAHELGHVQLGHRNKFDTDKEVCANFGPNGNRSPDEQAADIFASEVLAPPHRLGEIAERHGWTWKELAQPATIYQLAIRLGISYVATVWALYNAKSLEFPEAQQLSASGIPAGLKKGLSDGLLTNSWADSWHLTPADANTTFESGPDDVFAVDLTEHASSGYLWKIESPRDAKPAHVITKLPDEAVGAPTNKRLLLRFPEPGVHPLHLVEMRPWNRDIANDVAIQIEGWGKHLQGQSRLHRQLKIERRNN